MTVEIIDGIRILKLSDTPQHSHQDNDTLTMLHLWRLLTGGQALRDITAAPRSLM